MSDPHYHRDERGMLVKCYHGGRSVVTSPYFWFFMTVFSFPIEHYLWTHVWPFTLVSHWFGL